MIKNLSHLFCDIDIYYSTRVFSRFTTCPALVALQVFAFFEEAASAFWMRKASRLMPLRCVWCTTSRFWHWINCRCMVDPKIGRIQQLQQCQVDACRQILSLGICSKPQNVCFHWHSVQLGGHTDYQIFWWHVFVNWLQLCCNHGTHWCSGLLLMLPWWKNHGLCSVDEAPGGLSFRAQVMVWVRVSRTAMLEGCLDFPTHNDDEILCFWWH